jgi:hypothetical protein
MFHRSMQIVAQMRGDLREGWKILSDRWNLKFHSQEPFFVVTTQRWKGALQRWTTSHQIE